MMEEKVRELIAKAPDLAQPIEEFAYKYQQWLIELEAALAESGPFHPDSQRILEEAKGPATAKEKEVPMPGADKEQTREIPLSHLPNGELEPMPLPPLAKAGEMSGEWTLEEYDEER